MLDERYQASALHQASPTCVVRVHDGLTAACAQHSPRPTPRQARAQDTADPMSRLTQPRAIAILNLDGGSLEEAGPRPTLHPEEYYARDLHSEENMMTERVQHKFHLLHAEQARALREERHSDAVAADKTPDRFRLSRRHCSPRPECLSPQSQDLTTIASSSTEPVLAAAMADGRGYFKALAKILKARHEFNTIDSL